MNIQRQSAARRAVSIGRGLIVSYPLPIFFLAFTVLFAITMKWNIAGRETQENSPEAVAQKASEQRQMDDQREINLALDFVRTKLRDPDSASFGSVRVVRRGTQTAICGSVNAKNGFGGMAGTEPFAFADFHVHLSSDGREAKAEITRLC